MGRNHRPIPHVGGASIELDDLSKKREKRLKYWREKILAQEQEYKISCEDNSESRVREREAAFNEGYATLLAHEERH